MKCLVLVLLPAALLAAVPPQAPMPRQAPPMEKVYSGRDIWLSPFKLPEGMRAYTPAKQTQWIAVVNNADAIRSAPVCRLAAKWHQSGGMEGIEGVVSQKFKLVPEQPKEWIGNIAVRNSFGSFQNNRGLKREYPAGTRTDDVLSYDGKCFEHRTWQKGEDGEWTSRVIFKDIDARPPGYTGLKVSCKSCHEQAGTGGYASGLVPGGDMVLSDPLPWHLVGGKAEDAPREGEFEIVGGEQFQPSYGGYGGNMNRGRGGRRR